MIEEVKIYIDPVMADGICRQALRKFAVTKGLDDKKPFASKNWHWYSKHKIQGVTFFGLKREVANAV